MKPRRLFPPGNAMMVSRLLQQPRMGGQEGASQGFPAHPKTH